MKEKGFRIIALQMLSLFTVLAVLGIPVYATETGTTSGMSAKVYESMNEEGTVVANVIRGSRFTILSTETDEDGAQWYYICTNTGIEGYIQETETILEAEEIQQEEEQATKQQIEVMQNVNIREQPTTGAEIIGRVPQHTILEPLQVQENEAGERWYQISYEGIVGYVKESAVELIETPQESEEEESQSEEMENVQVERVQEDLTESENVEYAYSDIQEEKKVTDETEKETAIQETTRKAVNPIDHIVVLFLSGIVLSFIPIIFVQKAFRKERQRLADKNRKMRRG